MRRVRVKEKPLTAKRMTGKMLKIGLPPRTGTQLLLPLRPTLTAMH